jgi:hypothetical protein
MGTQKIGRGVYVRLELRMQNVSIMFRASQCCWLEDRRPICWGGRTGRFSSKVVQSRHLDLPPASGRSISRVDLGQSRAVRPLVKSSFFYYSLSQVTLDGSSLTTHACFYSSSHVETSGVKIVSSPITQGRFWAGWPHRAAYVYGNCR